MLKIVEKIIKKIKTKAFKIWVKISYYLYGNKLQNEQKEKEQNWKYYVYIKRKYKKFLNNLPYRENTNEFSNKIWWCWLQGEENAPKLNRACLNSLRNNLIDREIIIITLNNYKEYVELPEYIIQKFEKGIITKTHFSDILRVNLLVKHGGTWIDSSVLCTSYDKDIFDNNLFVYQNWKTGDNSIMCSSWFITSEKNNPILDDVRILLNEYWKKNNFLINYFLFHFFLTLSIEKYKKQWENMDRFSNIPPHILQFELLKEYSEKRFKQIENMSSFHKLNQKLDFSKCNGKSNYDYIIKKYLKK